LAPFATPNGAFLLPLKHPQPETRRPPTTPFLRSQFLPAANSAPQETPMHTYLATVAPILIVIAIIAVLIG
jgi:hypothetical protein